MSWGSAVGGLFSAIGSIVSTAQSNREARKAAQIANAETWKYYQKQKELDYQYDLNKYFDLDKKYSEYSYDLQRRYTENSALWQMNALRKAGLNPLLAVSNGLSSVDGGVVQAQRNGGNMSRAEKANVNRADVSTALAQGVKAVSDAVAADNTEANTALQSAQKSQVDTQSALNAELVNTEKMKQANLAASTAKTQLQADELSLKAGFKKDASKIYQSAKEGVSDLVDDKTTISDVTDKALNSIRNFSSSTARQRHYDEHYTENRPDEKRQMESLGYSHGDDGWSKSRSGRGRSLYEPSLHHFQIR